MLQRTFLQARQRCSAELITEDFVWVRDPVMNNMCLTIDRFAYFLTRDCRRCRSSSSCLSLQLLTVPACPYLKQLHPSLFLSIWRCNLDMLSDEGQRRFGEVGSLEETRLDRLEARRGLLTMGPV